MTRRGTPSAMLVVTLACSGSLGSAGCRDGRRPPADAATDGVSAPAPAIDAHDAGPPVRCTLDASGADVAGFGAGAELGEAAAFGGGYAFGALRAVDGGRVAAVLFAGLPSMKVTDLGSSWGDAPPPQPFTRGEDLYAAAYVRRAGQHGSRALTVFDVRARDRPLELPQESDASAAYDVVVAAPGSPVGALVAWDDVDPARAGLSHGVVQLAALSPDMRAISSSRKIEATSEDPLRPGFASDPRLAPRPGGFWLTWIARRPERVTTPLPLPAGEIETPSEEATYGWVEALTLDARGAPVGVPRRLTAATGHVGTFAAVTIDTGALLVVAEDDGSAGVVGGGSLEQVTWRGEGAPEVTHLVHGGVAEDSVPSIVASASGGDPWLVFRDVHGDAELMPLLPGLGHAGVRPSPSVEPLLAGSRPLAATAASPGVAGRLAVAAEGPAGWALRSLSCTR